MTSRSDTSSTSSRRTALAARLSAVRLRQAQGSSQADTPPVSGVFTRGSAEDVSGESGGGTVFPKVLDFETDLSDAAGTPVQAFPFTNSVDMCGAKIGVGMFFCIDPNCFKASHRKLGARIAVAGKLYIPVSSGKTKAFCEPCLDPDSLDDEVGDLLVSNPFPDKRLKWVFKELKIDPFSLSHDEIHAYLHGNNDMNKERMKQALTPAKGLEARKDTVIAEYEQLLKRLEKDLLPDIEGILTIDQDSMPTGKDFHNVKTAILSSVTSLAESTSISALAADDIASLKASCGDVLLKLGAVVGSDPGIGGRDIGGFSSAWEGIEFVHKSFVDLQDTFEERSRMDTTALSDMRLQLDTFGHQFNSWQDSMAENVMERSGRYAKALKSHIEDTVGNLLDSLAEEEEAGTHSDGSSDQKQPSRGVTWEGGFGSLSGGNVGNGGQGQDNFGNNGGNRGNDQPGGVDPNVGLDLDVNAELTKLREGMSKMKTELNHLKSVTSTGSLKFPMCNLEFESEDALLRYLQKIDASVGLPDHLHTYFGDLWALLDEASNQVDGEMRQSSDAQLAKQHESAKKANFDNPSVLSRWAGFQRSTPLAFEPPNTPATTNRLMFPLPGLKHFDNWDNDGDGAMGRKQMIEQEFDRCVETMELNTHSKLSGHDLADILRFCEASLTSATDVRTKLYTWIKDTYTKECRNSSAQEAWALVAGCIRAICDDVRDARLIGRATSGLDGLALEARLIWGMGMGAMKLLEFKELRFHAHPSCVNVYTQFMNRARTSTSAFKELEKKVKSMHGEIARLTGEVEKLKSKKAGKRQQDQQVAEE